MAVARGLDQPRQVHDGVGAAELLDEAVARDISGDPARAIEVQARAAAGEADDVIDRRVGTERHQHARADVAGRARDDDPHQAPAPGCRPPAP